MPTTVNGLTFYQEQFETGLYFGLTQKVNAFNGASSGAITLQAGAKKGLLPKHTVFNNIQGLLQARDPQGSGTLVPLKFKDAEHGSVKVFYSAPVEFAAQEWEDIGLADATATRLYGQNFGEALAERLLNAAISALVGGIGAIGATALHDVSASDTFDYPALNRGAGKMGDGRASLRTIVGFSQVFTDLLGEAYSSQQVAFQLGSATIYNGSLPTMGLNMVATDAPPLFTAGAPDKHDTLILVPGAVMVKTGPTRNQFLALPGTTGAVPENFTWLLGTEGSFEIKLRGVSWTGAAKPNDAALATTGNWTPLGTSSPVKEGPGIIVKSQ